MSELPDYSDLVESPAVEGDSLQRLSQMGARLQELAIDRAEADAKLKGIDKAIRDLKEFQIPELMAEVGLSEVTLADGSKLSVGTDVRASIPKARAEAAYAWLLENGYGDLVKHHVVVDAGKGDASELIAAIEASGHMARDEQAVHSSTLKKFIRDALAEGQDVPLELFGAYVFNTTKLKAAKKTDF